MNNVLLGNIVALIGSALMVAGGFVKRRERILPLQCLQFSFQCAANFILGAVTGGISNIVNIIRNVVFYRYKSSVPLKIAFIVLLAALSFFTADGGFLGWIPVIASAVFTWCIDSKNETVLKCSIIVGQVLWVIYDLSYKNYVSVTFDALTIASNLVGIVMILRGGKKS